MSSASAGAHGRASARRVRRKSDSRRRCSASTRLAVCGALPFDCSAMSRIAWFRYRAPAAPGMMRIIAGGQVAGHPVSEVALEQAEFFRALGPDRLARVRPAVRERRLPPRATLFVEGQPAEALWAIGQGAVRLYKSSADGRVTTLETLGPGEIFGALSALEVDRYPASAESLGQVVAWTLARSTFLRLLAEAPRRARAHPGVRPRRRALAARPRAIAGGERRRGASHPPHPRRGCRHDRRDRDPRAAPLPPPGHHPRRRRAGVGDRSGRPATHRRRIVS